MQLHPMRSVLRRPALPLAASLAWGLAFKAATAQDNQGSWSSRANMPMAVGGADAAEIDGIFYVAGGETAPYSSLNTLFAYDPRTDSWTRKTDMPTARALPVASVINGILYVVGGGTANALDPTAAAEAYDPKTDTWTVKASMPTARSAAASCAVDGLMYVVGGWTASGGHSRVVECYDPQTDQWAPKDDLPQGTHACVAQAINGIIYVFTINGNFAYDPKTDGWRALASAPGSFESVNSMAGVIDGLVYLFGGLWPSTPYCGTALSLAYDPFQDRFTERRMLPSPCATAASASIGGKVYLAGGVSGHPTDCAGAVYYDRLWVFDPHGVPTPPPGSWTQKKDMPMTVGGAAAAEIEGILYAAGGEPAPGSPLKTLFAYDPKTDSWTRKADMPTARAAAVASAINGILYVMGGGNPSATDPIAAAEAYDPKTDTWTVKTRMPTARTDMAACAVDGLMYVIGGIVAGGSYSSVVECYDPQRDQWTRKRDLLDTSAACAAQAVNGIIYVFSFKSTFAYDRENDRWSRVASMPGSFESINSMVGFADGLVYLFGGLSYNSPHCATALSIAYDPDLDRFRGRRLLPSPCAIGASACLGGKIYVIGGASGHPTICPGAVYYKNLWVFDPQGGARPEILSFTREGTDSVRFVWQAETGRLYAVESTSNPLNPNWGRFKLATGNTIRATNRVVEATGTVPPETAARFFRVVEAE